MGYLIDTLDDDEDEELIIKEILEESDDEYDVEIIITKV